MFDTIHHIAIIGSDYEKSKHFYVDLLGFEIIRENYRKERDDYKIDLACGPQEIELFIIKNAPARVNYPVSALSKGGFSMHTNPVIMIARC